MDGKVYLQNFVRHTLRNSGQSLALAQRITGQKRIYTQSQVENIILDWLEANEYGNEEICQVIDIHIDKPYFDLYYELMQAKQKENDEIEKLNDQKAKKMNATAKVDDGVTMPTKFSVPKVVCGVSFLLLGGAIVMSFLNVGE